MVPQAVDGLYRPPPDALAAGPAQGSVQDPLVKYVFLRSVLAPQYAGLPSEQLEGFMESRYGPGAAEQFDDYFESFFGDVGNFISKAAPVVANIGGGVIRGATAGAALGLPGIIGGAVAGGVGQGLASYGSGTLRDIGQGINTGVGVAGQLSGTGRIGSTIGGAVSGIGQGKNVIGTALGAATSLAGGSGGAAAGGAPAGLAGALGGLLTGGRGGSSASQVLGLLQQPEVRRALASLAMGSAGARTVPVTSAQTPVPTSIIGSLLGQLLNAAADEQMALSDGAERNLEYLTDDAGEWVVDPAEPSQRAQRAYYLLSVAEYERLLQAAQAQQAQQVVQQQYLQGQAAYQEQLRRAQQWQRRLNRETAILDAIEMAEVYAMGEDAGEDTGEYDEYVEGELDEYDEYAVS